jgi:Zn-dependent peptidase ImmA (M78 family)
MRVQVRPELLRWARERARLELGTLSGRFPKIAAWEAGDTRPTLKQLERFAKATHTPIGYLFLPEPPVEHVPIPDFRRVGGAPIGRPSPDLLDVLYISQQRQDWYREFARSTGEATLRFVGSVDIGTGIEDAASTIRRALSFDLGEQRRSPTWTDALRGFIEKADLTGVLVMISGVVGNNNLRVLDPNEFRGFALVDDFAPLVFINGADTKAAQMFTLAHELAHIWLGQSALSDIDPISWSANRIESWCNRVAAELLVPLDVFRAEYRRGFEMRAELARLARIFKVSSLVILRRIHDAGGLTREQLRIEYDRELERLRAIPRSSGGNFYLTQGARLSRRFARAVVASTLEGQTLHRDAFRLLGIAKVATFHELGNSLGVL